MASKYNPYSDIEKVYNAKVAWSKATTDSERRKQNEIANAARKNLEAYGYGDIANQISAGSGDATTTRKILEQYAPKDTYTDSELINKNNNEVTNKINTLWGTQTDDHSDITKMYKKEYDDIKNTNPFTTDEAKAILGKYDLAGLQGRDNAVASGGASNGGNIDSYSAANAMRQQASLVSQGQTAVLNAHQQKLDNARAILEGLGAYQQNSYAGMQNTIGLQQTEGQRLFENEETAKNNETARLEVEAGVTGYTPTAWAIKNDDVYSTYLNEDGTFKKEMENVDIQTLINNAKASGDEETAKKLAVVRGKKILSNYDVYGKYANAGDISYMTPQETEARRQFNEQNATALESLRSNEKINSDKNAAALEQSKMASSTATSEAVAKAEREAYYDAQYESLINLFSATETNKRKFITEKIKPLFDAAKKGNSYPEKTISDLIQEYTTDYNIDVDDAERICNILGVSTDWLSAYKDDTENVYGGMVRK